MLSIWRDALKIPFPPSEAAHCYLNSYILLRGDEESREAVSAQGHLCVSTDKRERKRKRGERCPIRLPSLLLSFWRSCRWAGIGVARLLLNWGQLSARLCWNYGLAFCPQRTDLAVTLNTASPRGWQILSPHFTQLCYENSLMTANPAPLAAPLNLISHLRHNGKIRPLWTGICEDSWEIRTHAGMTREGKS